jgi:hypothetical protein
MRPLGGGARELGRDVLGRRRERVDDLLRACRTRARQHLEALGLGVGVGSGSGLGLASGLALGLRHLEARAAALRDDDPSIGQGRAEERPSELGGADDALV